MSEYTPTTGDIKLAWAVEVDEIGHAAVVPDLVVQFDRWLVEHDRVVAERAWDEGFSRGFYAGQSYPDGADASEPDIDNPYRKEQENGDPR